jgi:hypothetical protein
MNFSATYFYPTCLLLSKFSIKHFVSISDNSMHVACSVNPIPLDTKMVYIIPSVKSKGNGRPITVREGPEGD